MAHITSIGAGLFTNLAVAEPTTPLTANDIAALDTGSEFQALFATAINSIGGTPAANTFILLPNIRELPPIGTPPNIVNVPVYGSKTSQQVQGQADAPSFELTLNFVPAEWAAGTLLGDMVGDGEVRIFRMALMNSESTGSGATKWASTAPGIGTVANTQYYWAGKIEALQIQPQLGDANTATVTLSVQSRIFGGYTI